MPLQFHNTLTKAVEPFTSQEPGFVKLYTCGPTVYDYLHVGNWAAYIYWDTLVRTLQANRYDVERVMNITDVGHLVSDADDGQDKLEKGAQREGKTAWEIAEFYGNDFLEGMNRLNLVAPEHITKATDYITQQLELVCTLKDKGYTYQIDDGIYFDTSKFPTYAQFAGLDLDAQKAGARVIFNDEKRNPSDFALWKFTPTGEKRDMEWETPVELLDISIAPESPAQITAHKKAVEGGVSSVAEDSAFPAGASQDKINQLAASGSEVSEDARPEQDIEAAAGSKAGAVSEDLSSKTGVPNGDIPIMGFPGWHLECSAMAMNILGNTLDIHTGGIDHIPVHHTNEIAQSEAASGVRFSNFWLHNNHLKVDGTKISKSLQNGYTLNDLNERGYSEMDYRLFVLQSHYRTEGNFTFDNLTSAKNRLKHWRNIAALRHQIHDTLQNDGTKSSDEHALSPLASSQAIIEALSDDLNVPEALKIIDEAFSQLEAKPLTDIHRQGFVELLETVDDTLGIQLLETTPDINDEQKHLIIERQRARDNKDWATSDTLRDQLLEQDIVIRDAAYGPVWAYA